MTKTTTTSIFDYLDSRAYLRDFYTAKKKSVRGYSYRAFARKAGVKSPNHLKLVIDGQRNLSNAMALKFARGCQLGEEEANYFRLMVRFTQANTSSERSTCYQQLLGSRHYRKTHKIAEAQATYYGTWYMTAIRELVAYRDFQEDPGWIAKQLRPSISKREAKKGLETLIELGLVSRNQHGKLQQVDTLLTTGTETTTALQLANYHRTMLGSASRAIDEVPAAERDISALTLGLSAEGLGRFKERLQRFRKELLELSATEECVEQVVQINFQLFPLTTTRKKP